MQHFEMRKTRKTDFQFLVYAGFLSVGTDSAQLSADPSWIPCACFSKAGVGSKADDIARESMQNSTQKMKI
jgi:hypothetical protein